MKQTPLYPVYSSYPGVKLIDFGGWELPVNFQTGILAEHMKVRNQVGLFDVSHMGEFVLEGPGSDEFLHWLVTNDVLSMSDGQVLYTLMCYPEGGVVDDLIIYRKGKDSYLLVVNAANIDKDFSWITKANSNFSDSSGAAKPVIRNVSDDYVQIALQGPNAEDVLQILWSECTEIEFFHFSDQVEIKGLPCLISRTGYTGEDGFEIYIDSEHGPAMWNLLLEVGEPFGIAPCGLGARDTLRLEAKLPLYGHELSKDITPLEANLSVFISFDTGEFCGRNALVKQKEVGIPRSLRGIIMEDKGVPRNGYEVYVGDEHIGFVTSGAKSPLLDSFIGLVLIKRGIGLKIGDLVDIDIRGKRKKARLVKTPFYKNTGRKK